MRWEDVIQELETQEREEEEKVELTDFEKDLLVKLGIMKKKTYPPSTLKGYTLYVTEICTLCKKRKEYSLYLKATKECLKADLSFYSSSSSSPIKEEIKILSKCSFCRERLFSLEKEILVEMLLKEKDNQKERERRIKK